MQAMPDIGCLLIAKSTLAGHAAAAEGLLVADARPASLGRRLCRWDQRFDALPQRGGDLFTKGNAANFCDLRNWMQVGFVSDSKFLVGEEAETVWMTLRLFSAFASGPVPTS